MPSDRRHGQEWPLWRTHQELDWLRQESRVRSRANSYARGLLRNLVNNVIGKGYSYKARPNVPDGGTPDAELEALVTKVQDCIDAFLRMNNWNGSIDPRGNLTIAGSRERECFRRVLRDGEAFLRFHLQDDGTVQVRWIEPEQVRDQGGALWQDGWSFGIKHRMEPFEDVETLEEYSIYWQDPSAKGGEGDSKADQGHYESVPADEVLHLKGSDTDSTIKRGTPFFIWDTGAALDRAAKVQRNASLGAAVRAATAEIWQHRVGTQSQISGLAGGLAAFQRTDPGTGKAQNYERVPPGSRLRIPQDQELVPLPEDHSESYLVAGQGDLRQAAAAACAPEFWMAETSSGNYSNLESAAAPAVRDGQCEQEYYKTAFARAVWKAVEWAAESGTLGVDVEKLAELVVIEAEAPAVLHRDELERAQEDQIGVSTGWKDRQTCAEERGLDWGKVQASNQEYNDTMGGQGMGLPMPDEQGNLPPETGGAPPLTEGADPCRCRDAALVEAAAKAGFTGRDKHGHCWQNGKQVKCPKTAGAGNKDKKSANNSGGHPGAAHGSSVTVKLTKERAFNGKPVPTKTTLTKQETGRVGEAVSIAFMKQIMGRKDARPMNSGQTNFPVDSIEDHAPTEIKAGLVSNGSGAQQWRLTFSKESAAEKALYETMTTEERTAWNAEKQKRIHERKQAVITALEKETGQKVKPRTMTVIINPDTRTADVYLFDGLHDRIGWNSPEAKAAYQGSVKYG